MIWSVVSITPHIFHSIGPPHFLFLNWKADWILFLWVSLAEIRVCEGEGLRSFFTKGLGQLGALAMV